MLTSTTTTDTLHSLLLLLPPLLLLPLLLLLFLLLLCFSLPPVESSHSPSPRQWLGLMALLLLLRLLLPFLPVFLKSGRIRGGKMLVNVRRGEEWREGGGEGGLGYCMLLLSGRNLLTPCKARRFEQL